MEKIKLRLLRDSSKSPTYGSDFSAGADIYADIENELVIPPHSTAFVPSGFALAIPHGYVGLVCARSGLACKRHLAPANKVGVIDADYRGEVLVALHNHSEEAAVIQPSERIAQLLIVPVMAPGFELTDSLPETDRGEGGFGSTGKL